MKEKRYEKGKNEKERNELDWDTVMGGT